MNKKVIGLASIIVLSILGFYMFHDKELTIKETQLQDSLSFELALIYGSDQGIRDMKLITRKETGAIKLSPYLDSINFFKILDFVKTHGMPSEKLLGKDNFSRECVQSAFVAVMLHNPHMLVNQ
ncbi:hypothetical protein ACXR6G_05335 [Ancylomarina sp. YFZ004]